MVIHTVRQGESLYSIAGRYGVTVQKLIADNGLEDPNQLAVGQAIVITSDNIRYTVARGESLYTIARNFGTTVASLRSANPGITDPAKIQAGQVIVIPTPGKRGTIEVNGYAFPNINSDTLARTLPHLTYISPFSYQVRPDGTLPTIPDSTILQTARQRRVAPLMVITNLKEGGGFDSDLGRTILTNEQVQNTLLENVIRILGRGYYGLDIDFEYIYPQNREDYNRFLTKVTRRLHPLGYTVSTALAPKTSGSQKGLLYEGHDYPTHGSLVDHVILMTYEWGYTYGPPQAVAPIGQVERVLKYAVSVIPNRKILMGIPNYGYDWTLPFVQGSAARSLSNPAAVSLAVRMGVPIQYDTQAQAPFFNYVDGNGREHVVWFEDARSIEAKLNLVSKYNLGGVSYWTINRFFPQNWAVLESMYIVRKVI